MAASTGAPEFRDPKTGQVWTPETVGQDGRPIGPEDAAFDPRAQAAPLQMVLQKATARPVGQVPITAGPTVPIVNMENATLRAIPGQRWQVVMYLNNNSGNPVEPVVECRFTNAGKPVRTRAPRSPRWAGRACRRRGHGAAHQLLRRQGIVPGGLAIATASKPPLAFSVVLLGSMRRPLWSRRRSRRRMPPASQEGRSLARSVLG